LPLEKTTAHHGRHQLSLPTEEWTHTYSSLPAGQLMVSYHIEHAACADCRLHALAEHSHSV